MPLRLVQIVIPEGCEAEADELMEVVVPVGRWPLGQPSGGEMIQFVVQADEAEPLMDRFTERFEGHDDFRVVLSSVEALVPKPEKRREGDPPPHSGEEKKAPSRVSREELHADAMDSSKLTGVFLAMVAASTVVAAVGVLRDDVAVIIGAMVIAPLLGPNVALAMAATLADARLARQAILTNLAGVAVALGISAAVGALVTVDPTVSAIASRTRPSTSDVVLALAAGTAGAMAFTSGFPQAVIGVMVAVALLPPLVILGLLLGAGAPALALGAFLLVAINVISVNLAGVATFLARGLRPAGWWEAEQAKTAVRWAVATWTVLLMVLGAVLWVAHGQGFGPFGN
jgi:uncharacterized hydrophobic protein (TIGR00341 family)